MWLSPGSGELLRAMPKSSGAVEQSSTGPFVRVTVLTEAGPDIGYGHLARCVGLADAFLVRGLTPRLIVRGETPAYLLGGHDVECLDWTSATALDVIAGSTDVIAVDSYTASADVCERLAEAVSTCIWFDDEMREEYPGGIIVNGAPGVSRTAYAERPDATLLLGTTYQVLRRSFWDTPPKKVRPQVERLLVMFGGTDVRGLAGAVIAALEATHPGITIDAVREPRTAAEIRNAMLEADIAISAGGQTLYELAATGTPTIAVCVAENQDRQARAFAEAGVIRLVGSWSEPDIVEKLTVSVEAMGPAGVRHGMSSAGQELVDGRGALRVAQAAVDHARRVQAE